MADQDGDLYGDEESAAPAAPAEEKSEPGEKKTALIDSAICPGMEPGEEFPVRVEKVLDKEYLVSYEPKAEEEVEEEAAPEETPMPGPMRGRISEMME
jgi:hypothetical protein